MSSEAFPFFIILKNVEHPFIAITPRSTWRFPKVSPKVNVIAQMEFEFTYNNVIVQHVSHDTIEIPQKSFLRQ